MSQAQSMVLPHVARTHDEVADHYNELDPIYRQLWGEHVHHGLWETGRETVEEATEALSNLVGERLGFSRGDALVDIGCGYGATARLFAARGAKVTGFSLSTGQLAAARPAANVTLHLRDWLQNDLPAAAFDGAYAIESSEHISDKHAFFREAARVLKPGGRLVVCAWLADEQATPWQVRHLLQPICDEGRLPSMGTPASYRAMAQNAGLVVEGYDDVSAKVARTWTICLRRLLRALATDASVRSLVFRARNRAFALSLPRLILAYRSRAMRYGVFTFVKSD
jgi:tocopherol O-methyltransferase